MGACGVHLITENYGISYNMIAGTVYKTRLHFVRGVPSRRAVGRGGGQRLKFRYPNSYFELHLDPVGLHTLRSESTANSNNKC